MAPGGTQPRGLAEFDENGVDITLIRWMLSLSPAERLGVLERFVAAILEIRARNSAI